MNPYEILGLRYGASVQEIKQAYRQLVLRYHPDKVFGEEEKQMAQHKFQEINNAYEHLLNQKHSDLDEEEQNPRNKRFQRFNFMFNQREPEIFVGNPKGGVFIFIASINPRDSNFFFVPQKHFGFPASTTSSDEDSGTATSDIPTSTSTPSTNSTNMNDSTDSTDSNDNGTTTDCTRNSSTDTGTNSNDLYIRGSWIFNVSPEFQDSQTQLYTNHSAKKNRRKGFYWGHQNRIRLPPFSFSLFLDGFRNLCF